MILRPEYQEACALIWRHWQSGEVMDDLPAVLKPRTRAAGYAVQANFEAFSSTPRAGWKIAATSTAGQRHINVDGPIAGRLLSERLCRDNATVSIETNRMRVCEPEFAFRFGDDIQPQQTPYTVPEVMAKVADLHLTIEIPDSRFSDFTRVGAPSLIADNACARDLVVSVPVTANWREIDLSTHPVTAAVAGRYDREGTGANVLTDPRVALAWLVNEVSALGITIRRGELVTTGTCMTPLEVAPGDRVTADYGDLGKVGVTLAGTKAPQDSD
jgi:2-keto-4-pentenoate hydratase